MDKTKVSYFSDSIWLWVVADSHQEAVVAADAEVEAVAEVNNKIDKI